MVMEESVFGGVPGSERSKLRSHVGAIMASMHQCIVLNDVPKLLDMWRWLIPSVAHLIPREERHLFRITHDPNAHDDDVVFARIMDAWGALVPILSQHNVYGWPVSHDPIDAWYLALNDEEGEGDDEAVESMTRDQSPDWSADVDVDSDSLFE